MLGNLKEGIQRRVYRGLDATVNAAKSAARTSVTTATAVFGSTSPVASTTQALALDIAQAILSPVDKDGQQGFELADGRTTTDESYIASQLVNLEIDLFHSNGSLNHSAVLLNNPELVDKLIEFATNHEANTNQELRSKSQMLLAKLVDASHVNFGSCPDEIKDLIKASSLSNPKDPQAKAQKAIAITKLITKVNDRFFYLDSREALSNYVLKIPGGFYGQVGETMANFVKATMNEFLANPSAVLNDPDLELEPHLQAELSVAMGEMFISSVIKPMRDDALVLKAKDLITAFEEQSRDIAGSKRIGIDDARKEFIEAITNIRIGIAKLVHETNDLAHHKDQIQEAINSKSPTLVRREFCTPAQIGSSKDPYIFVVPTEKNILAINNEIASRNHKKQKQTEALEKSKHVIGVSLEAAASPFGDAKPGLRDMFFDRLVGKIQDEKSDKDAKNMVELLLDKEEDLNLDYSELISTPDYGDSFTGVKKLVVDVLKNKKEELEREKNEIELFDQHYQIESTRLESEFWSPLKTAFDYRNLASETIIKDTKKKLGEFCSKDSIHSDIAKSLDSYESQLRNIFFKQLIVKGDKDYIVNEQLINSLKLSDADKTTLITELTLAANQLNVNSASDQKYQAKLVDIQVQLNNVLPILKDNQAALLAFAPDEELDESKNDPRFVLAQSVQTMFTAHSEAMIHIATAVEYERKASESSAIDKIADIGLDAKFIRPELTGDIALAKFLLAKRSANNIKLEQINSMLVPAHKEFQFSWEKELKRPQFVKSTATTLNDDFVQMGMGRAHIDQIVKQIDEYGFDFKTDDEDRSVFYTMIKDIVKSLIQYITQFSEGVKK